MSTTDALHALRSLITHPDPMTAAAELRTDPTVKRLLAPLTDVLRWSPTRHRVVASCVALPATSPLRSAALALIADGTIDWPVFGAVAEAVPARTALQLLRARHAPTAFAIEHDRRVSMWSLESGAHLGDLAVPGKRDTFLVRLADLPDGTVRGLTNTGVAVVRAPGAPAFTPARDFGRLYTSAATTDLSTIAVVRQATPLPIERADGAWIECEIWRFGEAKVTRVLLPLSRYDGELTIVDDATVVLGGARSASGDDDGVATIVLVDLKTGDVRALPWAHAVSVFPSAAPHCVQVSDGTRTFEVDIRTGAERPTVAAEVTGAVPFGDGYAYDADAGEITRAGGVVGYWFPPEDVRSVEAVADAATGTFAFASTTRPAPVCVVRRLVGGEAARPVAAAPPLAWATPGTRIHVSIADFDADDAWSFEVLEATDELVIRAAIDGAGAEGAFGVRFTATALTGGTGFVSFAQDGCDAGDAPVTDRQPAFVLARDAFTALLRSDPLAYGSPWVERDQLEPAGEDVVAVEIDGALRRVPVRRARGEYVSLAVLDDARWPLLLDRTEGDCHVRVTRIELGTRALAPSAGDGAAYSPEVWPVAAPPPSGCACRSSRCAACATRVT